MPRACPVESHVRRYTESKPNALDGLCPKSPNRAWIGSVPSAVADGSNDQRAIFPNNFDCHGLTHPLPRTVLML
jgi:hypothetical protein